MKYWPFKPSEAVQMKRVLEPTFRKEARQRMAHGATAPGRAASGHAAAIGGALDLLAMKLGMSRATLVRAERIISAAEQHPDLFGDLVAKMDERKNVHGVFRELCARLQARSGARHERQRSPGISREASGRDHCNLIAGHRSNTLPGISRNRSG